MWAGLADGTLDLVATDHVADRRGVEKSEAAKGVAFDKISNGAPGIETLLTMVHAGRAAQRTDRSSGWSTSCRRHRPACSACERKGAIETGKDADLVLFDPAARRTIRAADLHHTSDYTPYEGLNVAGAVRSVFVRGRAVVRDGALRRRSRLRAGSSSAARSGRDGRAVARRTRRSRRERLSRRSPEKLPA